MRKYNKFLAVALCAVVAFSSTGCSQLDKLKNAITNTESDEKEEPSDCASYVTLADYKNISLKTSEIDEETENQITSNIKNADSYKKVKKGKVKSGDTVNIYYVGRINGKKFDGGSCTKKTNKEGYDLEIGSNTFIDGFEDGLIGKKIGSTVKVKTQFPDTYGNADVAGKKAVFTVTINYKKSYSKLTDKVVKECFSGFSEDYDETAAGYTEYIRQSVIASKAWESVYNDSKVNDYPSDKLESMENQLTTSITNYLSQQGYSDLSSYLEAMGTSSEDFQAELETTAKEDVGKQLIYGAIGEKEGIEITDDEYQTELETYLTNYNCEDEDALNDMFNQYYGISAESIINDDILYDKVKSFLVENVTES